MTPNQVRNIDGNYNTRTRVSHTGLGIGSLQQSNAHLVEGRKEGLPGRMENSISLRFQASRLH
ncbi:MAG: hypothetical protein K2X93_08640 [Candidatus Obscuribacterales bacterium]|nr:hypothetical protein [Candidatus Obscuribacterales bacterium]